ERGALQRAGEQLDRETDGRWVAEDVAPQVEKAPGDGVVLLDAARIERQLHHLRQRYADKVFHLHLTASDAILAERYEKRDPQIKEFATYPELKNHPTKAAVFDLALQTNFTLFPTSTRHAWSRCSHFPSIASQLLLYDA